MVMSAYQADLQGISGKIVRAESRMERVPHEVWKEIAAMETKAAIRQSERRASELARAEKLDVTAVQTYGMPWRRNPSVCIRTKRSFGAIRYGGLLVLCQPRSDNVIA